VALNPDGAREIGGGARNDMGLTKNGRSGSNQTNPRALKKKREIGGEKGEKKHHPSS
jgi:hypothetical protein